ncbi:nicotinate phosphoribosyltransferase [Propionibacterium cyclohexanicum]|uniref:Nicotinate phosphoribosyltransferase n=1 Tax=Propionibacterium cyclohexanicum TaxID=64702 RepID=A0A1H9QCX8_9ACTN|nr:nicotinate phosphoribosyltransferase [Propionibacterium cyclohexanicum]SER58396.1 nicotinate phosphoribosyltransferase [Propionibacterium cyclohexanicum]
MTSTALLTDMYELTMVRAALHSGTASRHVLFELFPRRLPTGRGYGVVAGTGRMLEALRDFRFGDAEIDYLLKAQVADDALAEFLSGFRFGGDMVGYPEGELYFGGSPLLQVEGSFAEVVVLETALLSIYNHDSAIASAASRMTMAAEGRPILEFGARRTHEESAVAAARAAYIAGFGATSDLEAGRRFGLPVSGTAAHAFVMLFDTEEEAFKAQLDWLGEDTTLLVDTYDVEQAIRTAVRLTDGKLGGVRIDSGDLSTEVRQVRAQLDALGATQTRIIVTNDLDEYQIAALRAAPVDGFGVGTALVTGSGHPTCGFVYKMVAKASSDEPGAPMHAVAKKSANKNTIGGRKFALRRIDERGIAQAEVIGVDLAPRADSNDRSLLTDLVKGGQIVGDEPIQVARERHERVRAELPMNGRHLANAEPAIPTLILDEAGRPTDNVYQVGPAPTNL